jgi:hypothetical protein
MLPTAVLVLLLVALLTWSAAVRAGACPGHWLTLGLNVLLPQ